MTQLQPRFWPKGLSRQLHVPATSLSHNLEVAAARFPDKPALIFFDTVLTYARLKREVDAMAGYLQSQCGVRKGDRVMLFSQNCPQFVIAYYAILRADAVVVPVNAMSTRQEAVHYMEDSGARVALVARELYDRVQDLPLDRVIVHTYADYLEVPSSLPMPAWTGERHAEITTPEVIDWLEALAAGCPPQSPTAGTEDTCVLPYTSGTTGQPKGCVHTHGTVMAAVWSAAMWRRLSSETVFLGVAPMFHMLGMQNGMNLPILLGATVVIAPRWDRDFAGEAITRYKVTAWTVPTAALVDFFANPAAGSYDLSSLTLVTGGGGAIPETLSQLLVTKFGITLNQGYGMSETASFLFCNPLDHPKPNSLGVPTFGVDARIIDPESLAPLEVGQVGEIVVRGGQVMKGYWNNPKGTRETFIEIGGETFLRTGDLGHVDEDGYYFMTDRLKRMINVSGFKVWPAEVENRLYEHPAILEACVIGVPDERQGEAVKALVVLKPEARGKVSEEAIIAWARSQMAVYKAPRTIAFVENFPRSSTGKILWRELS